MTADLLRRAAALMRERAMAATPGPWETYTTLSVAGVRSAWGRRVAYGPHSIRSKENAEHVASWHPSVALDVADLLDLEALHEESGIADASPGALAVARTYLGEPS